MSKLFTFVEHPWIATRKTQKPPKVADQLPKSGGPLIRFNTWLALKVTNGVGTMWCAYAFTLIALISLPAAIKSGSTITIVSWVAQTFLQLVLLSIIIVGQNVQSAAADKRSEATYLDADAVLHTALQIQQHLEAQDIAIEQIVEALARVRQGAAGGAGAGTRPVAAAPKATKATETTRTTKAASRPATKATAARKAAPAKRPGVAKAAPGRRRAPVRTG